MRTAVFALSDTCTPIAPNLITHQEQANTCDDNAQRDIILSFNSGRHVQWAQQKRVGTIPPSSVANHFIRFRSNKADQSRLLCTQAELMSTIQLVTHAFNRILPKRKLAALFTTVNPPFCQSYPHPNTAKVLKQVVICINLILLDSYN